MKNHTLQEMKDWLILNILDEENIGWMSNNEIIDTFNKYFNEDIK
jgi:hypothetical protein